jgi:hypothetical protein
MPANKPRGNHHEGAKQNGCEHLHEKRQILPVIGNRRSWSPKRKNAPAGRAEQ